jgi:hypothetical protein
MNKLIKYILLTVIVLGILAFAASYFIKKETKKNSPQDTVEYVNDSVKLKMVYCQPFKKGRVIFGSVEEGALQPYGQYWRLGANEATTLETTKDLIFKDHILKKGIYAIYAVPDIKVWKFGFNKDADRWGVNEPDYTKDVLTVEAPVNYTTESLEQFTIKINANEIVFKWDTSVVKLPYKVVVN